MAGASLRTIFPRQAVLAACLAFGGVGLLTAQQKGYRPLPRYVQTGVPDQAQGERILEQFRQLAGAGEGFYTIEFRVMPRRGADHRLAGWMWRGSNSTGPISRVVLSPGESDGQQRWLVQNGPEPVVWRWTPTDPEGTHQMGLSSLLEPIADTQITPFDLQMPFMYWKDFVFEGVARVRGRPTHAFLLYPPEAFAEQNPTFSGVRVYLDLEYRAMVQAEQIGSEGRPLKTMTVIDLKKVGDHWIVKSIDLRDEATRDKTRFSVTGAAVGMGFASSLFEPSMLGAPVAPPPPDRIERITP